MCFVTFMTDANLVEFKGGCIGNINILIGDCMNLSLFKQRV